VDPLVEQLNATVTRRWDITPTLAIFRVETDGELFDFTAGQYCVLGLPPSFPRIAEADPEDPPDPEKKPKLIRRAYSIASSSKQREHLEFYVALVTSGALTPRMWALQVGDRIWVGPKATGLFTLDQVPAEAPLYLLSTGTGLAPYMSMLGAELADLTVTRSVVVAHGARYSSDLGYRAELEVFARKKESFSYIPSITRPGEDPEWDGEVGYVQAQIEDGRLEKLSGVPLDPQAVHIFLCGNPAMVEAATELLLERGFTEWSKRENPEGTIHTEKYW